MSIHIVEEKFVIAHEVFSRYMFQKSDGVPFTDFQHPFLIDDEIAYKWGVYNTAKRILDLQKWARWKAKSPGKIVEAVKGACKSSVSENLLEHRYGVRNSSAGALYKADSPEKIEELGSQLFDFFLGGAPDPAEFGPRFDGLADFLRKNRLGCNWAFLAYLAFLSSPQVYFPIRPTRFDALLHHYGIGVSISGYVSWERYKILLDLGEALKRKLVVYGTPNAIEIQSYMWVISYLLQDESMTDQKAFEIDFGSELKERVSKAKERERIGLLGEKYIYEEERKKLRKANRDDLVDKVTLVSMNDDSHEFDILSFTSEGTPLHIEVKTTTRSPVDDHGFWLSENERLKAEQDIYWSVYRVWNINMSPSYQDLGNIILDKGENWELRASSWYVQHRKAG